MPIDVSKPTHILGCYLSEQKTQAFVDYLKQQLLPGNMLTLSGDEDIAQGRLFEEDDVDRKLFAQTIPAYGE
ncbi:hypothetical protein CTKA_01944 [Chthonomonas calidirosea]|uniref:hypothetical protein n=1 Tax=Chthonomonas calidirosea TaxID=454171 RepID=UPI0003A9A58A|nr:hypothetical protein [Chthonomonas calidirosea]CEK18749.1 hypothetical protein CTKA_01944 [Chthonomonas calidirosea]